MQALHEGAHEGAVAVFEVPDVGTVDDLAGHLGGEFVDLFVQVHDQQVQAVAVLALTVGEGVQLCLVELFAVEGVEPVLPLMHALVWFLVGGAGHQHRAGHQGEVVVQGADESVQLGDEQEAINPAGPDGQFVQPGGVAQSGGQHLVAEVECFALGVLGMRQSGLQDCQIEFESVIGPECRFDPHRHQQTLLTQ